VPLLAGDSAVAQARLFTWWSGPRGPFVTLEVPTVSVVPTPVPIPVPTPQKEETR
jgi:hypothetical protein